MKTTETEPNTPERGREKEKKGRLLFYTDFKMFVGLEGFLQNIVSINGQNKQVGETKQKTLKLQEFVQSSGFGKRQKESKYSI